MVKNALAARRLALAKSLSDEGLEYLLGRLAKGHGIGNRKPERHREATFHGGRPTVLLTVTGSRVRNPPSGATTAFRWRVHVGGASGFVSGVTHRSRCRGLRQSATIHFNRRNRKSVQEVPKKNISLSPPAYNPLIINGRGGQIRTDDFLLPKQALYQAELRPEVVAGAWS